MGVFGTVGYKWRVSRMTDPADGVLEVHSCAQPETSPDSASYSAEIRGWVSAPGITRRRVQVTTGVPAKRCPQHKQRIPVTVDLADPDRIAVNWERVPLRRRAVW